ncbi:hypothetical protein [Paenibacillus aquistagni]|uniref:hypothetical protein n=1 Tax=Paenibacillus aquistagni TaxID=1852522 RepID=UPI00145B5ED5|nr:hypothetical protein [Paenibacillus aquistagni]NMM52155.1 hypothetical protein [Paenibacillus aquistagni]
MQRQVKQASNTISSFADNANKRFLSITKTVSTFTATTIAAVTGLAVKSGFSEAMDLEGFRLQLETATKDAKKAAEIMSYSIDLANKTPFEGGELVQGAAKLEAMGMSAKKWLPQIGDMAAATNKPFDQAIEAIIDAQAGELERLKEFGITKAKITEKANEMFRNQEVVNNKGQIVDQEKFNQAMVQIMNDRFTGGMEKQSTTLKGIWSTVTGVTKSALSNIVGITSDGSIRQGSLYEMLKDKIKSVASTLERWQSDGTLQKIADEVTNKVSAAIEFLSNSVKWLKDNMDWLAPVAAGLLSTFIAFNIISKVAGFVKTLTGVIKGITAAQGAWNVVMAMNPIGLIATAIGLLVTAGILLWKNWDTVKAKATQLWQYLTNVFNNIKSSVTQVWTNLSNWLSSFPFGQAILGIVENIRNSVEQIFNGIITFVKGVFSGNWSQAWTGIVESFKGTFNLIKTYAKAPINFIVGLINGLIDKINGISVEIPDWVPSVGGETFGFSIPKIPEFKTGTSYFKGGLARTDEAGGEIKALPNGTKIIPHDLSKRMLGGQGGVNVYVTVQGNVIGNEQYANQMGDYIARKIMLALGNK